jgi:tight adherence protein B
LFEALNRMADRIDEPDVRFFTVVLAVQQEAGGNLSEVLTNLSSIIRKRRVLRLKIKALASEGRATSWILGSLPLFVFCVIYYMSPDHLRPLWETSSGHFVVLCVLGMEFMGLMIVRQIVNMEV